MTGNNPSPWTNPLDSDVMTLHYQVTIWGGYDSTSFVTMPAYDLEVSLDATRVPFGEATFKTPPLPWDATWPTGGPLTGIDSPAKITTSVEIRAGYDPGNMPVLMLGVVTKATETESREAGGENYISWTVQTAEMLFEYPSHRAYDVNNSYTSVWQVCDYMSGSGNPWLVSPDVWGYSLNTPDAGQLASFRACEIAPGDIVGDFLRQCAQTLGQRLLPDWRVPIGPDALHYRCIPEPAVSTTNPLVLTSIIASAGSHGGQGGTVLNFNAKWYSSGDAKTSSRLFYSPIDFPAAAGNGLPRAIVADAEVYVKPPGGSVPDDPTWAPVARWESRITKQLSRHSVTARAALWLQPFDAITYNGKTIVIDRVTFDLIAGTMTAEGYKP